MKKLLILLMIIAAPVWAAEPFTPAQEARIKEMIRETLVSNPDILAQAVDAWQQQTAGQQISQAIKQNAKTLYQDPASPRLGAANAKLTLVTFTDYNCPYCKRFDPMLEKIVKQYPDVALVVKLLPFKGESSVSSARVALTTATAPGSILGLASAADGEKGFHDNASIAAAQENRRQGGGAQRTEHDHAAHQYGAGGTTGRAGDAGDADRRSDAAGGGVV